MLALQVAVAAVVRASSVVKMGICRETVRNLVVVVVVTLVVTAVSLDTLHEIVPGSLLMVSWIL